MKSLLVLILLQVLIFHNSVLQAQWVQASNGFTITPYYYGNHPLAVTGSKIFAGNYDGVYLSTDNGLNWAPSSNGMDIPVDVSSLVINGNSIFAGTARGVYLSTNLGLNWSLVNSGLTDLNITALAMIGNNIFAGTYNKTVFLSTNNGSNWVQVRNGIPYNLYSVRGFGVNGTTIFTSLSNSNEGGVYRSTDYGSNWVKVMNNGAMAFGTNGGNVFLGSGDFIYLSTDNGSNWSTLTVGLPSFRILNAISFYENVIFLGYQYSDYPSPLCGGVHFSTNNGSSWIEANDGLPSTVRALAISGNYIFAGCLENGIWRRPLNQLVSAVENEPSKLPACFSLDQNYPNPFNPTTTLNYSIPKEGSVKLSVYDVTGSKVATVVDEYKPTGNYSVRFNGTNLPSGVYLYRLESGNFTDAKKFILMK